MSMKERQPVKVVLVTTLPPVHTSLSEYGKFLVEGLLGTAETVDLHVLADCASQPGAIQEIQHPRLQVERCWKLNALGNPLRLIQRLKALEPDLVIFNLQFASFGTRKLPAMLGLTAPALARLMGFRVLTVLHNLPEAMELDAPCFGRSRLETALIRAGGNVATRLLLTSDKLVVTLDSYRKILADKYHADNVEVIGLGSYIAPAQSLSLQRANRFLTFGKFGTYKKLESLIEAFAVLAETHADLELVIGGSDHPSTPGYLAGIEARYRHLPFVKFIGWIEDEALPGLIRDAKALVLSYESTAGSSGPLHLALSQGKPVIAPDMGDFRRVAEAEGARLLFYRPQDPHGLSRMLATVIRNEVDLAGISRQNLGVAQRYSATVTAQKYTDLIGQILQTEPITAPLALLPVTPCESLPHAS